MSDIANELRERSLRAEQEGEPLALLDEAADEIERLRLSANGDCPEPENAADEDKVFPAQNMTTLTDAEREAVERARDSIASTMPYESVQSAADWKTLSGLLERLGGAANSPPIPRTCCGECLTDAEREAVEVAAEAYASDHGERFAATLRALLERLG
jgi:hypothetical protein